MSVNRPPAPAPVKPDSKPAPAKPAFKTPKEINAGNKSWLDSAPLQSQQSANGPLWGRYGTPSMVAVERAYASNGEAFPLGNMYGRPTTDFWLDPYRIVRYRNMLKTTNAEPPDWLDPVAIENAYKYLEFRNGGKPWYQWKALDDDDPAAEWLKTWKIPDKASMPEREWSIYQKDEVTQPYTFDQVEGTHGISDEEWAKLPALQRFIIPLLSAGGWKAGAAMGATTTAPFAAIAAVGGSPVAGLATLGIGAGLGGVIGALGEKYPALMQGLMALDLPAEGVERLIGLGWQLGGSISDPDKYGSVSELVNDFPSAWKSFTMTYEAMASAKSGKVTQLGTALPIELEQTMVGLAGIVSMQTDIRNMLEGKSQETIEEINQRYRDLYGFTGMGSDLLGHMILDPLNIVGPVGKAGVKGFAKATKNTELLKAVTQVVDKKEGLTRILPAYKLQLKMTDLTDTAKVDKYSKFAKSFAGIGEITDGNYYWKTYTDPFKKKPGPLGWFQYDAASMATEVTSQATDNFMLLISEATAEESQKLFHAIGKINPGSAGDVTLAGWTKGRGGAVFPIVMRSIAKKADDLYENAYLLPQAQRAFMLDLAKTLNKDPYFALKDVDNLIKQPDGLAVLRKQLETLGTPEAKRLLAKIDDPLNPITANKLVDMVDNFKKGNWALTDAEYKGKLIELVGDGVEDWAAKWFGVKKDGIIMRLSQTVKDVQSLLLLAPNAHYLFQNTTDNIASLAYAGVFKMELPSTRDAFWKRFGFSPLRRKQGVTAAEVAGKILSDYQPGKIIKKARMGKGGGITGGISELSSSISGKWYTATGASQKVEAASSDVAYTVATRRFLDKNHKVGIGFDKMPTDHEAALTRLGVDPNTIYRGIEAGLSKAEIEKNLWVGIAKNSLENMATDDELKVLKELGAYDDLAARLVKASDAEVPKIFDDAFKQLRTGMDEKVANNARYIMEGVMARASASGGQEVMHVVHNQFTKRMRYWQQHEDNLLTIAAEANKIKNKKGWKARAEYQSKAMKRVNADWERQKLIDLAEIEGMSRAMGQSDPRAVEIVTTSKHMYDRWSGYFKTKNDMMDNYNLSVYDKKGRAVEGWMGLKKQINDILGANRTLSLDTVPDEVRHTEMYKLMDEAWGALYDDATYNELNDLDTINTRFLDMLRGTHPLAVPEAEKFVAETMRNRLKMIEAMKMFRHGTKMSITGEDAVQLEQAINRITGGKRPIDMSPEDKNKAWEKFNTTIYKPLMAETLQGDMQNATQAYHSVQASQAAGAQPVPQATVNVNDIPLDMNAVRAIRIEDVDPNIGTVTKNANGTYNYTPGKLVTDGGFSMSLKEASQVDAEFALKEAAWRQSLKQQPVPPKDIDVGSITPEQHRTVTNNIRKYASDYMLDSEGKKIPLDGSYDDIILKTINENSGGTYTSLDEIEPRLARFALDQYDAKMRGLTMEEYARKKYHKNINELYDMHTDVGEKLKQSAKKRKIAETTTVEMTRDLYSKNMDRFVVHNTAETKKIMPVFDALSAYWGKRAGKSYDEWYKANIGDVVKGGIKKGDMTLEQTAYHGGGVDFDAFDLKYAGSGEGGAAFGYGVYLTETDIVADHYRNISSNLKSNTPQGQLYRVDIPDDGYILWDRTYLEQTTDVKDKLAKIEGAVYHNIDIGRDIYQRIKKKYGGSQKQASEKLKEAGIVGIKYLDGFSRREDTGTYNYVMFNDKDIKITGKRFTDDPNILFQKAKGAISWAENGKAIIHALEKSDASTAIHETGHAFLRSLVGVADDDIGIVTKWLKDEHGIDLPKDWVADPDVLKYKQAHELFSKSLEAYLLEGKAPKYSGLQRIFDDVKAIMIRIYHRISAMDDVKLDDNMRAMFDKWISVDVDNAPPDFIKNPMGYADKYIPPPIEQMEHESYMGDLKRVLDGLEAKYLSEDSIAPTGLGKSIMDGAAKAGMSAEEAADVLRQTRAYAANSGNQLQDTKYMAMKWGESMRDHALLNYSKRMNFDNYLGVIAPYSFWATHAGFEWAMRSLDRPAMMANYSRLREFQRDTVDRPNFPTRLKNKSAIDVPFLPDWLGGSIYIDPLRRIFPQMKFFSPIEKISDQNNLQYKKALSILQDMVNDETLTQAEAITARDTQNEVWQKVAAQAAHEIDAEITNPFDVFSLLYGASLPIQWTYNALTGRKDNIGQLPLTRTIQNATKILGLGGPAGINIEAPLRNALGLPEVDKYYDYRVDKALSGLVADKTIENTPENVQAVVTAMIERKGELYDMARDRVAKEGVLKYAGSILSLDFFPEGEQQQRGLRDEYSKAIEDWSAGDEEAINNFFEEHPEYDAQLQSWREPEERMRRFLRAEIWNAYNELDSANKKVWRARFGDTFDQAFINKETRSYDAIDTQTLAMWAGAIGGKVPEQKEFVQPMNTEEFQNMTQPTIPGTELYDPQQARAVQTYYDTREALYPGVLEVQSIYYSLSKDDRSKMLRSFPDLKKYWDWNRAYKANHPLVADYVEEQSKLYEDQDLQGQLSTLDPLVVKQLLLSNNTGRNLGTGAKEYLYSYWLELGQPYGSFDKYVERLQGLLE